MTPPKHAARGREDESLVIYLSFSGNTPISSSEYNQIANQMAQRFYQNPGSLTAAMRATVETLNQVLVDRNLRTTGKGQYIVGRLILGVLHETRFVLAQCGPTHVFHFSGREARPIHDMQISGRGLGFGQSTTLYYAQADLHPGDLLVLCAHLPSVWESVLSTESNASADVLRRKLVALTEDDLNAVLVQVQSGRGNLNLLSGARSAGTAPEAPARQSADKPGPEAAPSASPAPPPRPQSSKVESSQPASRLNRLLNGRETESPAETPVLPPSVPRQAGTSEHPAPVRTPAVPRRPNRFITPRGSSDIPEFTRPASPRRQKAFHNLAMVLQGFRAFFQTISQFAGKFLPRLVPSFKEDEAGIPGSTMALIAVAVPVLVVMVAYIIYSSYGQVGEYTQNYNQALAAANTAVSQKDPIDVRRSWDTVLYYLDNADKYRNTSDSQALRQEAQTALDNLDGILRLDFTAAIAGGLSRAVHVSAMAATDNDLYLLNSAHGNVMRAYRTGQNYEIDTSFKCDPGQYGNTSVGPLIDIAALPKVNTRNATVLAIDANATLLYCAPNADPLAVTLGAPELGWRGISRFVLDTSGNNLYVLDPAGNAVWVYAGNFGDFPNLPILFFGDQVPQNMNLAIDLVVNGDDLYLLFKDGHVTSCTLGQLNVVPTRCTDPVTYVDTRPGQQAGPIISDAVFTQMTFAAPPDMSLYMFEPLTQAIYRFSPRSDNLTLQGQLRATEDQRNFMLADPATAMAISPERSLFLSVGNQVYFANDIP